MLSIWNQNKENGTDIDLWTFEELFQAVVEFQEIQDHEEQHHHELDEEDDVYKYVHPAEIQKLKGRHERVQKHHESAKNANESYLAEQTKSQHSNDDSEEVKVSAVKNPERHLNDQGGWEQEEIDLDSLNSEDK